MTDEQENRNSWLQRITPIAAIAFASLLVGLILPVLAFGERLAIQEERMRVTVDGVASLRGSVENMDEKINELRETLAAQNFERRGRK